jgi:IclR family transcriptional regulator, pca regulon regulatory protein
MAATKMGVAATPGPRNFIASLEHGLAILEALASEMGEMSLAALATHARLKKTTAWRLAHTLVRLGYLRQDKETKRFSLAPRVLSVGYAYFESLDLKQLAEPFLRDLSERLGETVNMAILDGYDLVYVERIKTSQLVNINLHVGSRLPLYNTSLGRALAAEMSADWLRQYIDSLLTVAAAKQFVRNGGEKLLEILRETRERGYALNDQDLALGLRSIASPIRDKSRKAVAAINVAVPSARVSVVDLHRIHAPELLKTSAEISAALGFRYR